MTWTINGTDPKTLGLIVGNVGGWLDLPARRRITATIPGVAGARVLDADPPEAPIHFVANGYVIGTTAADTRSKLDIIVALFTAGIVRVSFVDQPTRQTFCEVESITVTAPDAQMIERKIPISIALVANDPFAYDTAQQAVNVAVAATAMPLGTGPTRPVIQIGAGSGSSGANPVLTAKDNGGTVIGSMTFGAIGFGGADVMLIDCAKKTITFNGVSRLDLLTAGDFFVFDIAKHGQFGTSSWPTLASSIAATAATTARYNKAWR